LTKDEALKLALEALENLYDTCDWHGDDGKEAMVNAPKAITAIKEALAQPEQEPMFNWLPKHKCGLHLSHNEHRDVYETVEEFYDVDSFISIEELAKAISEDSVWVLHWYPETPIGFYRIAASTLEAIADRLKEKNT